MADKLHQQQINSETTINTVKRAQKSMASSKQCHNFLFQVFTTVYYVNSNCSVNVLNIYKKRITFKTGFCGTWFIHISLIYVIGDNLTSNRSMVRPLWVWKKIHATWVIWVDLSRFEQTWADLSRLEWIEWALFDGAALPTFDWAWVRNMQTRIYFVSMCFSCIIKSFCWSFIIWHWTSLNAGDFSLFNSHNCILFHSIFSFIFRLNDSGKTNYELEKVEWNIIFLLYKNYYNKICGIIRCAKCFFFF